MRPAIEMRNITKAFSGVIANDHVDLTVEAGEVHCLLGENGAGKTTLMNVLFGLYQPDEGEIRVRGERVAITSPHVALAMGLGMVHQHFMLVNRMTVLENVLLGAEIGKFVLDMKGAARTVEALCRKFGFELDLNAPAEALSVGRRQRVEILKALFRGAEVLILDEPTAVLTPGEVDELFAILGGLRDEGKTVIFITHKLNETMEIADAITVLRAGRKVADVRKTDTSPRELARLMVGHDLDSPVSAGPTAAGRVKLELRDIPLRRADGPAVSLEVRAGEILGIAGVEGNGQLELEELVMGLRIPASGSILLNGADIRQENTRRRKLLGIAYIPSDRHRRAMLPGFSVEENYLLGYHSRRPFSVRGILRERKLRDFSLATVESYDIRTSGIQQQMRYLSGGNQQKVIISREVSHDPQVVVAAQPTRGLDIGATDYVHSLLLRLRDEGRAILLISADLSEITRLSDRIAVLYEGRIMGMRPKERFPREEIGLLMAGKEVAKEGAQDSAEGE